MIPSILARRAREMVLDYLRTTFSPADREFEDRLFRFLDGPEGLFRGPYIDLRLPFRRAPEDAWVPLEYTPSFRPYAHQVESFHRLSSMGDREPRSTLVTTGTGSGKTECFLYPILDHCLRHKDAPGVKAILIYPMNALANDQARRLARELWTSPVLKGAVSAGMYIGGRGEHSISGPDHLVDSRSTLRSSPPDILLTNYRMLDFLLLRPEDSALWKHNTPETLRYLVLDELHTYDGAQGTDVACLVRRLRARLRMPTGRLCCVGTSATMGGKSRDEASRALVDFAAKIFGEPFGQDSVITEERLSIREALGDDVDLHRFPPAESLRDLDPDQYARPEEWMRSQARLWLGEDASDLSPVGIGARLFRHGFLRLLLQALDGKPRTIEEIRGYVSRMDAGFGRLAQADQIRCMESFLGLVAHARRPAPGGDDPESVEPFLTLQMHLWMRELRRLLARVGPTGADDDLPRFAWHDQLSTRAHTGGDPCAAAVVPDNHGARWLPLAWCRDCGAFGLASFLREGRLELQTDPAAIGTAWLDRSDTCRFVSYGTAAPGETQSYLCPACLRLAYEARCFCDRSRPVAGLPVRVSRETSQADTGERPRFLGRCPECGANRQLSILGSRAPSLLSVVLSNYYSDPYNSDRKMLAFTDSVQDASHRASFFAGRTYRFNLRRAIQVFLESVDAHVPLPEAAGRIIEHWHDGVGEHDRIGLTRLVAALMPPDLRHLDTFQAFMSGGHDRIPAQLEQDLLSRLSWEIVMEYGLAVRAGRTLEGTLCSTVRFDATLLDDVAGKLALDIQEEGMLRSAPAGGTPAASLRYWLAGLLLRWRRQGGIVHELIRPYFRSRGNSYRLGKHTQHLLSPFSSESVLPVFITNGPAQEPRRRRTLETVVSPTGSGTWYRDWAGRALGIDSRDEGLNDVYRLTLRRLVHAGILEVHTDRGAEVFGIRPESLSLTRRLKGLECPACRRRWVFPDEGTDLTAGGRCPAFRCAGSLVPAQAEPDNYYANLYRSGRIERIFPGEHTGLLSRAQREKIEDRFKSGQSPDGPNMIVCTPTLEMGIDVGDLSGVMLCSVPPTTSNFLQRIGRAGRRTGNSLCFTMVVTRPHDLFFHAEPLEMMAGAVFPPGCFLDAPEILYRQLAAHAMDQWALEEEAVGQLPPDAARCLSESGWAIFPGKFLEYLEHNREAVLESFLRLFGETLSVHNRERIEAFARTDSVRNRVKGAFESIRVEQRELRNILKRARQRLRELELNPEAADRPEADLEDIQEAIRIIRRLIEELGRKYPLNVLTDAGVIPNYAFPEPGVTLDSVITERRRDGRHEHIVYNFQRPASSAIREFAPFNTFYADGRKVRVDEIDLGPRDQPLMEDWRFCAACSHMRRVVQEEAVEAACPRCQDPGWADAGQVRSLVLFRKARSLTPAHEAGSVDDSDDRIEERYRLLDLVETAPENRCGAWAIQSLPFGYEILKDQVLRQINFGRMSGRDQPVRIAGTDVQAPGFEVCLRCGRVRDDGDINHAPQCPSRRNGRQEQTREVFLYREVKSEALRILLPVAEVGVEAALASFQAALDLGFRRHFQGNPGHLVMTRQQEPAEGGGHRNYLVIFDAVPGGTGYLAELVQGGAFFQVLEAARRALVVCNCRLDPTRDGCYRCLFGYRGAHQREITSSRCAEQILTRIIEHREECVPVDTLSDISVAERLESELEIRFLRAIESRVRRTDGAAWDRFLLHGEYAYRASFGAGATGAVSHGPASGTPPSHGPASGNSAAQGPVWTIRPQVSLGAADGVHPSCRPDFLMELTKRVSGPGPDGLSRQPGGSPQTTPAIAVFCDGLAYHVRPGEAEGGIADDIRKRKGVLRTGRHRVWSVTWDDIDDFERDREDYPAGLLSDVDLPRVRQVIERLADSGGTASGATSTVGGPQWQGLVRLGSMNMLFRYMQWPDEQAWARLVEASSAIWLMDGANLPEDQLAGVEERLEESPARFRVPVRMEPRIQRSPGASKCAVPGRLHQAEWFTALMRCSGEDISRGRLDRIRAWLRLFDEHEARASASFRESWRSFLHAWNLLQFHPGLIAASSECLPDIYESDTALPKAADKSRRSDTGEPSSTGGSGADDGAGDRSPADVSRPDDGAGDVGESGGASHDDGELHELLAISPRRSGKLITEAHRAGYGLPVLDHEIRMSGGRVGPEAEMAWERHRVAVLSESQAQDLSAFEEEGWTVLVQPVEPGILISALGDTAKRGATGTAEKEE